MTAKTYPIALNHLQGRKVVVIGGGAVGERKVRGLLVVGAAITVISPAVTQHLQQLATDSTIRVALRHYQKTDLEGAFLVFAATDQRLSIAKSLRMRKQQASCAMWRMRQTREIFIRWVLCGRAMLWSLLGRMAKTLALPVVCGSKSPIG